CLQSNLGLEFRRVRLALLTFTHLLSSLHGRQLKLPVFFCLEFGVHYTPTKASSTRDKLTKLAIFISGSFEVSTAEDQPCMDRANCNVTFYTCRPDGEEGFVLAFFDAMHFDFEFANKQTAFHPIFHVQRGVSNNVGDETVRGLFNEHLHVDRDKVRFEDVQGAGLGTPYLRLPTPQLDMFSVMTLIMADFFCNGGKVDEDAKLVPQFRAILDYLRHEHNIIREGHGSKTLKARIDAESTKHVSAAHWYLECMDSGHVAASAS
ncbi:MAG TPA: hypothetical protein VF472_12570, partial [Burkholderiaceae bacterium]